MPTKNTALIVRADGTRVEVTYTDKEAFETFQAAVGGTITGVGLGMPGNMDAYANDNAFAEGLPLNLAVYLATGRQIPGDVVFPRLSDSKRKKLAAAGLLV